MLIGCVGGFLFFYWENERFVFAFAAALWEC